MLYTCGVNSKKYIMRISHTFLLAALCCVSSQVFAETYEGSKTYSEVTLDGINDTINNGNATIVGSTITNSTITADHIGLEQGQKYKDYISWELITVPTVLENTNLVSSDNAETTGGISIGAGCTITGGDITVGQYTGADSDVIKKGNHGIYVTSGAAVNVNSIKGTGATGAIWLNTDNNVASDSAVQITVAEGVILEQGSNITETSSLTAKSISSEGSITVNKSSKVTATDGDIVLKSGNIDTAELTASKGSVQLYGTDVKNSNITAEEVVLNSNTSLTIGGENGNSVFAGEIEVNDATLTLTDAALGGTGITMNSGTIEILGDATVGALTLNEGNLVFAGDYILDLGGESLILGENASIILKVDSVNNLAGNYELFANVDESSTGLENLTVKFVDDAGDEKEVEASYSNGGVMVSIPEPTTATLSLLALAGLAARRRRK